MCILRSFFANYERLERLLLDSALLHSCVLTLHSNDHSSFCLFRLGLNASPDFQVGHGGMKKPNFKLKDKNHKKLKNRRPETQATLPWSLEWSRNPHKLNLARGK